MQYERLGSITVGIIVLCAVVIPAGAHSGQPDTLYYKEIEAWRNRRLMRLTSEDGWLTLVGLFWLKEGENTLGSDPSNNIVLSQGKAPRFIGSLWLDRGEVRLEARPDAGVTQTGKPISTLTLRSDADEEPTVVTLGTLSFQIIKRGDRLGLRVKDKENPTRLRFAGLDYYPVNPKWRVEARFEPYNPPKTLPIVNILGMVENEVSPGAFAFEVEGKTYRLDAVLEKGSEELFIIFADQTNGKETYGGGRFLYAAPPHAGGRVVVDFNKAYNPPCALTSYTTCPLPPPQNRLPFRVEAGEKVYAGK
jgi:uncharacterized protein (DUF1684 family)